MLRALVVAIAMWTLVLGTSVAQTSPPSPASAYDLNSPPPSPDFDPASGPAAGADSSAENELLQAANQSREQSGAPPLRMDEGLRQAARAHARLMIASARLDHQFSGEPALLDRIAEVSRINLDRAGENVAYSTGASAAHDALMHSPPHRHNLLDGGFNVAGVAAIWSQGRLYVVQDFAHEVPSYSAKQSGHLVSQAIDDMRQQAGLPELVPLTPPNLDKAVCSLAAENRLNAHLLSTAYDNRKIIAYTQSRPEALPPAAVTMLRDPAVRQFAVGSCYVRSPAYPSGTYWVAILLY